MSEEKKTRQKLGKLGTVIAALERVVKSDAAIEKKLTSNVAKSDKVVAKLAGWGVKGVQRPLEGGATEEVPLNEATTREVLAAVVALKAAGYEPPRGRAAKPEAFKEGDNVQIKPDFSEAYAKLYQPEELSSMVYNFYDEINKVAMCDTATGRVINARPKHLIAR